MLLPPLPSHFNLSPGPRVLLNRVPTGKNGDAAPPEWEGWHITACHQLGPSALELNTAPLLFDRRSRSTVIKQSLPL